MKFLDFIFRSRIKSDSNVALEQPKNPDTNNNLGIEWYRYLGGINHDTSEFCKSRNGRYFHYLEVMNWAKDDWEGKHPETNEQNIFQLAGGFCNLDADNKQCHHMLMGVSEFAVPKDDVLRAIDKGYYRPGLTARECFGLE